jgi:hypothetical protein
LLFAMIVVLIVAAAASSIILSNSRGNEVRTADRDARAVSRAAINLLESELRMVDPFGVLAPTDATTLTARVPYAFGVVCLSDGSGTTVSLLPSFELPASLTVDGHTGWAWRDPTGMYVYESTTSLASGSAGNCTAAQVTDFSGLGGRIVSLPAASTTPVAAGSIVFLWRQLQYSIANSTTYPGRLGLFRTAGANGTPEELAAPFSAGSRFRFYIMNQLTPSDAAPTFLDNLRGIQFQLNGESVRQPRTASDVARAPFVTAVFFQNRPS